MHTPTIGPEALFSGRPSGCPSVNIYFARRDISLHLLEIFKWNLSEIFIMRVGVAKMVFKVKGQGEMSTNVSAITMEPYFLPRWIECRRGLAMIFLSVCQTRALWQNGRKLCLDFYIIWKNIYPSFLRRRMVGGGDPFYLKFWVKVTALERNRRFSFSLVAPQP